MALRDLRKDGSDEKETSIGAGNGFCHGIQSGYRAGCICGTGWGERSE